MLGKPDRSAGGKAATLFATTFVVIGGAIACMVVGVISGETPTRFLTITGACFGGILLLLWLLRDRNPGNVAAEKWSWLARSNRQKVAVRVAPRVPRRERASAPQGPPTAESVRELTGGMNVRWVPVRGNSSTPDADAPPSPR